jgi:hypothetical protein
MLKMTPAQFVSMQHLSGLEILAGFELPNWWVQAHLFLNNKYRAWYDQIVKRARDRGRPEGYFERRGVHGCKAKPDRCTVETSAA